MDQYHKPHKKKVRKGTGGKRRKFRDKKLAHTGGAFAATKVSEKDKKAKRKGRGGNEKWKLKTASYVNVSTKEGTKRVKIKSVLEGPQSDYVRQNIITKGTIVQTEIGKVKITSRPGQTATLNGVLLS